MNQDWISKFKKDFIIIYVARNGIATFFITWLAMSLDLSRYYDISIFSSFGHIFLDNVFTAMYFILLWIFNYLLFEAYKILSDWYDETHHTVFHFLFRTHDYSVNWVLYIVIALLTIVVMFSPLPYLFKMNTYLMVVFMTLRSMKQIYKNRL